MEALSKSYRNNPDRHLSAPGDAPLAPTHTDETEPDAGPVKRDASGRFLPGTSPGPGSPAQMIRGRNVVALAKHAKVEDAIAAYDTLVAAIKRGNVRAAIEFLRAFTDLLATRDGKPPVNATAIKIVVGVDESKL